VVTGNDLGRRTFSAVDATKVLVVLGALVVLPFLIPAYWLFLTSTSLIQALVVLSVVVLVRATSSLSLAQGAFAGISAYLCAWLYEEQNWPFLAAVGVSVATVVPIGMALAFPALRLRGLELSALTLALGLAASAIVFNARAPLSVGDGTGATLRKHPTPFGLDLARGHTMYWFLLAVTVLVFVLVMTLLAGPIGHTWQAIRAGNSVAGASGINITAYQLLGFAVSSAVAGLAGVLLLTFQRSVTPATVGPGASIFLVVTATVIGADRVIAAVVGGIALGIGNQVFPTFGLKGDWLTMIFGFVVVIAVVSRERQRQRLAT
jgi:branched-chain amino acid transport system permease protein